MLGTGLGVFMGKVGNFTPHRILGAFMTVVGRFVHTDVAIFAVNPVFSLA